MLANSVAGTQTELWSRGRLPFGIPLFCPVTASGQNRRPAAARSSASTVSPFGLRFPSDLCAKYGEKISPEPP